MILPLGVRFGRGPGFNSQSGPFFPFLSTASLVVYEFIFSSPLLIDFVPVAAEISVTVDYSF